MTLTKEAISTISILPCCFKPRCSVLYNLSANRDRVAFVKILNAELSVCLLPDINDSNHPPLLLILFAKGWAQSPLQPCVSIPRGDHLEGLQLHSAMLGGGNGNPQNRDISARHAFIPDTCTIPARLLCFYPPIRTDPAGISPPCCPKQQFRL